MTFGTILPSIMMLAAALCAVSSTALGNPCGVVDQECEWNMNGINCSNIDVRYPMMQSFTPLLPLLCGVELLLGPTYDESVITVRIQDTDIPDQGVLTSVTQSIPWRPTSWIYFSLPEVALEPGRVYYIFPTDEQGFLWCSGYPECDYPGGTGYADGVPVPFDWAFRTYGEAGTPAVAPTWGAIKTMFR